MTTLAGSFRVDVSLTNEGTGIVERQVTSETGEFIFNYVPGGTYNRSRSLASRLSRQGDLPGGGTKRPPHVLPGSRRNGGKRHRQRAAPLINTASPEQRINLDPQEVKTLPSANRNLTNLLNLGTGLTRQEGTVEGGGSGSGGAGGIRLRLNGLGGAAMSITANGTDASANAGARQISQYNGISKIDIVSIESVGEVQIVKGISPAEFGQALAGNLNIVTKGGTNNWHGSLFYRYEGAGLVAKPFFLREKPESKWNQGGGSLGGPLMRDRGFFFTAIESYRLQRALELNVNVPTPLFRDLLMASCPTPRPSCSWTSTSSRPSRWLRPPCWACSSAPATRRTTTTTWTPSRFPHQGRKSLGHLHLRAPVPAPGEPAAGAAASVEQPTRRASSSYAVARDAGALRRALATTTTGCREPIRSTTCSIRSIPGLRISKPRTAGRFRRSLSRSAHPRQRAAYPGAAAELFVRAAGHSGRREALLQVRRHLRHASGRAIQRHRSDLHVCLGGGLILNRPSSVSFRLRPVKGLWTTTNWGLFVQDDWRVNSKLVVNLGVRYDYFGRYMFEATDPENPAGIINLDGEPDPSFTFGPPRPRQDLRG